VEEIEGSLKSAGFTKIEKFRHLTLEPLQDDTLRATITAQKE
jgi:hypothetical protein